MRKTARRRERKPDAKQEPKGAQPFHRRIIRIHSSHRQDRSHAPLSIDHPIAGVSKFTKAQKAFSFSAFTPTLPLTAFASASRRLARIGRNVTCTPEVFAASK